MNLSDVLDKNVLDKVEKVCGILFPYVGVKKRALEVYLKDIEQSNLSPESKAFMMLNAKTTFRKLKNQGKIAEIAVENAKEGTDFSERSGIDEEWFDRFMDAAGSVSSEEMQLIWGKILASEFEKPGITPCSIIRILSEITLECAKAFSKISSMKVLLVILDDNNKSTSATWKYIVPFNNSKDYMKQLGLSFELMNELETLGLIKFDAVTGYSLISEVKAKKILIYSNRETLLLNDYNNVDIPIGNIMLTTAGMVLSNITPAINDKCYNQEIKKYMASNGFIFENTSNYKILVDGDKVTINIKTNCK